MSTPRRSHCLSVRNSGCSHPFIEEMMDRKNWLNPEYMLPLIFWAGQAWAVIHDFCQLSALMFLNLSMNMSAYVSARMVETLFPDGFFSMATSVSFHEKPSSPQPGPSAAWLPFHFLPLSSECCHESGSEPEPRLPSFAHEATQE